MGVSQYQLATLAKLVSSLLLSVDIRLTINKSVFGWSLLLCLHRAKAQNAAFVLPIFTSTNGRIMQGGIECRTVLNQKTLGFVYAALLAVSHLIVIVF